MPHCSVSSRFKTIEDEETARFEKHRPPVKDQIYINFMYITDEGYLRGAGRGGGVILLERGETK